MNNINKSNQIKAMFVLTQDLTTAEGLKKAGFELVDYQNDTWTFINNPNCPLCFADNSKIAYSNKLCI